MKKPLLFSLFVWMVLLVFPWTRGQTRLDWRGATLERLQEYHPAWGPLVPPYTPEKEVGVVRVASETSASVEPDTPADVKVNGLSVAPQFAAIARNSNDRDVLVWCAHSPKNAKLVTPNVEALSRRFPGDVALFAWACRTRMNELNLFTRHPGPLSSPSIAWSVQKIVGQQSSYYKLDFTARPKWDALAVQARRGQRMEPRNGFWWWLEVAALLGARRDEEVWPVLRAGSSKIVCDDHSLELPVALRRAHLKTLGTVPARFYLSGNDYSFLFYGRWREVARQVCENIIGARLQGRHKTALEGGRDLMLMGRLLRRSEQGLMGYVGSAIESIVLQNAATPSSSTFKRLIPGSSARVLAGHPRSLLRYANEQNRSDIALQITNEWNAMTKARRAQAAKAKALSISHVEGTSDALLALAAGSQNTGTLLVQTLPIPLVVLGVLSLPLLVFRRRGEAIAVPTWTRGLGWSAFALLVLFSAQVLLSHMVWQYMASNFWGTMYWGFDFILPRLVRVLPFWVFAFPACVALVGALWATLLSVRRARGDAPLMARLRFLLSSRDDRTGGLDLGPVMQLVGIVGVWTLIVAALGAWFFFPQEGALANNATGTLHDLYAGIALGLFCFVAAVPTVFLRVKGTSLRAFLAAWLGATRRFLVAHIALATVVYLLLAMSGAFFGARFDREWLQVNAPPTASSSR